MARLKVAVSIDETTLRRLDRMVRQRLFPSRRHAIQEAVSGKIERLEHSRLAQECRKLDPRFEKALAEECI